MPTAGGGLPLARRTEPAYQLGGRGLLDSWSGKVEHALEQGSPRATTAGPGSGAGAGASGPTSCSRRSAHPEPVGHAREATEGEPRAARLESPALAQLEKPRNSHEDQHHQK